MVGDKTAVLLYHACAVGGDAFITRAANRIICRVGVGCSLSVHWLFREACAFVFSLLCSLGSIAEAILLLFLSVRCVVCRYCAFRYPQ